MKKWQLIPILLILLFALAACDAGETTTGDPEADTFPETSQIIEDGVTPMSTSEAHGPGGEIITGVQPPVGIPPVDIPEGQVMDAPAMLTSLFVLDVAGQTGKAADVEAIILEPVNGQIQYLVVSTHGPVPSREMLLPLGAFYAISFPGDIETEGMQPAPMIWLMVEEDVLLNAPDFDRASLDRAQGLPEWDAESRAYWSDHLQLLPVTGGAEGETAGAPILMDGGLTGRAEFPAVDQNGNNVGVVENIILDQQGRALFIVLRPSSIPGVGGGDWIPVAWRAFAWDAEEEAFVLQVAPETLENAPRLDRDQFPDTTLPGWEGEWQQYWQQNGLGTEPAGTLAPETGTNSILLSVLQQRYAFTTSGEEVGQPADWIIDFDGQNRFAIIQLGSVFIPLPWRLLDWQHDEDRVEVGQEPPVVENAPSYISLEELDQEQDWQESVADYWANYVTLDESSRINNQLLVRTGQLLGQSVLSPGGGSLGIVEDLVLAPDNQPHYLLVDRGDALIPVPWLHFDFDQEKSRLIYLDDQQRFEEAPAFSDASELGLSRLNWDQQIRSYWGMN
jgi:sporulation protein YlmC with PRC-barrel domain